MARRHQRVSHYHRQQDALIAGSKMFDALIAAWSPGDWRGYRFLTNWALAGLLSFARRADRFGWCGSVQRRVRTAVVSVATSGLVTRPPNSVRMNASTS